ncbi:uncharacterized protein V1510DRAFT_403503 [Dipodascopsis tothii]|uniref:uncharacterized protein n=1 Tax=Dipodascopsis tothii TaxID=44089 RepID=UPI0034CE6A0B
MASRAFVSSPAFGSADFAGSPVFSNAQFADDAAPQTTSSAVADLFKPAAQPAGTIMLENALLQKFLPSTLLSAASPSASSPLSAFDDDHAPVPALSTSVSSIPSTIAASIKSVSSSASLSSFASASSASSVGSAVDAKRPALLSLQSAPAVVQATGKNAAGKYPCKECSRSYLHAKHLKRHMLRHTGDRPYKCVLCGDSFCRSDILKRHFEKCQIRRGAQVDASMLTQKRTQGKACDQCVRFKVKCNLGNPCNKCEVRDISCTYSRQANGAKGAAAQAAAAKAKRASIGNAAALAASAAAANKKLAAIKFESAAPSLAPSPNPAAVALGDDRDGATPASDPESYPTPVSVDTQFFDQFSSSKFGLTVGSAPSQLQLPTEAPSFFNEDFDLDSMSPPPFMYNALNSPEFLSPTSTATDITQPGSYMSEQYFSPVKPGSPSSFIDRLSVYSPIDMVNASCALEFQFPGYHSYIPPNDMSARLQGQPPSQTMQTIDEQVQLFDEAIAATESAKRSADDEMGALDSAYFFPYALGFDMMM